jgi:hypothetical protein
VSNQIKALAELLMGMDKAKNRSSAKVTL